MNLFYLISKRNARFARSNEVTIHRAQRNGKTWRGASIGAGGALYVERATECHPFKSRAASIGWYAQALGERAEITVSFIADDQVLGSYRTEVTSASFEPIFLPWPLDPVSSALDLKISCEGPAAVFIGSHFELNRKVLIGRCKGRGIELGPGPNPHVRPDKETEVSYLEQKSPEDWAKLYGEHYQMDFDLNLAPFYIVGEAHKIPAPDESLDFIYSSHVFEHLANPIGHLRLWSDLLRKGGEILMVIPDYIGSKDYLADATSIDEMLTEYRTENFEMSIHHYERFERSRQMSGQAQKLREKKSSIHVHFYSNHNMRELLDYVVGEGFFKSYTILHSANAKDFHVIIEK